MDIRVNNESTATVIVVEGIVKTIADTISIKEQIASLLQREPQKKIIIDFVDTFVIPSALIGALQKFILGDNAKISVIAGEPQLYELLDNLCLVSQLSVTKKIR
ncbi:hypothetical protein Sulku_1040 [Sulfuricurvum kujiense DSM 16994]|uniref:STAS domain-containing protein n=1 Tax=Sulfuricurvum kujiense (strain ATCC BAA-921 / DSM 16994 / JCM 11577 / YK-1) TaxID=709032 RepID=E4U333_SULKY|nr:hypothetical protein [Sulfuricurvum kujiense]ADR33703.1 hypothetical protein Sulku_1040 [Sulfuricurvum kujiense DSM 16994]